MTKPSQLVVIMGTGNVGSLEKTNVRDFRFEKIFSYSICSNRERKEGDNLPNINRKGVFQKRTGTLQSRLACCTPF